MSPAQESFERNEVRDIPVSSATELDERVTECWMDFDGARMRYLRAGSGPPLILLHGLLAYSFSWRYTLQSLAPYATVYAPDLMGAGFSDRDPPRGKTGTAPRRALGARVDT